MTQRFAGKTVLITGAATGIGRAIATAAGREGARLVLGDVAMPALETTGAALTAAGVEVMLGACDVRNGSDLARLVADGARRFGHPDVVYANAGVEGPPTVIQGYTEADFMRVIDVNVTGTWRTIQAVLPGMLARGSGVIVATASVAGLIGAPGLGAYIASKHAVVGLVKTTALEVAAHGVRINALCPGMTDTGMLDRLAGAQPGMRDALMALNPMKRLATVDEIAEAGMWLGADGSSYVTGTTLAVDGGFVAG